MATHHGPNIRITLKNHFLPRLDDGQPVVLQIVDESDWYLPVFSTVARLRAEMERAGIVYSVIAIIEDERQFLGSLPPEIRVALDPHESPDGGLHFHEVFYASRDIH